MTGTKRSHSETEVDDAELIAAEAASIEARENGDRAFRHWRDRGEPPASSAAVAMRQACPYRRGDGRVEPFCAGWELAAGTHWSHEYVARGLVQACRIVERDRSRVGIVLRDGTRLFTYERHLRKVSA